MSKFKTSIPIPVHALVEHLPERSHVSAIYWDPERAAVIVEWENDDLKTPFTYPVDWPDLSVMPDQVRDARRGRNPENVSCQQTSSPSQVDAGRNDAPGVKQKARSLRK